MNQALCFRQVSFVADLKISGYVWTWKFLYPERESCGFKNIRIRINRAYAINHNDDDENDRKPKLVFKWTKQQLCMSITLFSTFSLTSAARILHEYDVKPPNAMPHGLEDVNIWKQDAVGAYIWASMYCAWVKFLMCIRDVWVVQ